MGKIFNFDERLGIVFLSMMGVNVFVRISGCVCV